MANKQTTVQERIIVDPHILVGKPVIRGTRIPVSLILNLLAHGYDFTRIKEAYPVLSDEDIHAAIAYSEARLDSLQHHSWTQPDDAPIYCNRKM